MQRTETERANRPTRSSGHRASGVVSTACSNNSFWLSRDRRHCGRDEGDRLLREGLARPLCSERSSSQGSESPGGLKAESEVDQSRERARAHSDRGIQLRHEKPEASMNSTCTGWCYTVTCDEPTARPTHVWRMARRRAVTRQDGSGFCRAPKSGARGDRRRNTRGHRRQTIMRVHWPDAAGDHHGSTRARRP